MLQYQHIDLHIDVVASLLYEQQREKRPNEQEELRNFLSRNGAVSHSSGLHILGRGNAVPIGRLLAYGLDLPHVHSDEDNFSYNYSHLIGYPYITIVSASGSKGLIDLIRNLEQNDLGDKVNMVTSTEDNETSRIFPNIRQFVVPAMPGEPYTYNFATYCSMLLRASGEDIGRILKVLEELKPRILEKRIWEYSSYVFLVHPHLDPFKDVTRIKMREIFGENVAHTESKPNEFEHGFKTVKTRNELLMGFGVRPQTVYGGNSLYLNIQNIDQNIATMLSVLYFTIGYIQQGKHPWFEESIEEAVADKRRDGWKTIAPNVGGELPKDLVEQARDFIK